MGIQNKINVGGSSLHDLNQISRGTTLTGGNITSDGDFRIDGHFEGTIVTQGRIVIGVDAVVSGRIECSNAEIEGVFTGNMNVKEFLSVKASAKVSGEVCAEKLSVDLGSTFNVTCCKM